MKHIIYFITGIGIIFGITAIVILVLLLGLLITWLEEKLGTAAFLIPIALAVVYGVGRMWAEDIWGGPIK